VPSLKGKSIIITGGASGIGRASALLAAIHGANVTIADVDDRPGQALAEEIVTLGGNARYVHTDVSDELQVRALVDTAMDLYGRLDGAFNNAGVPPVGVPLAEITSAQFRHMIAVNLTAVFYCMKYEILAMSKGGGGAIINTSSSAAATMLANMADYGAAKYGVVGLTKAGAIDYAAKGIRVNAILPGAISTPMLLNTEKRHPGMRDFLVSEQPIGRLGEPQEVAAVAIFLLSDAASLMTGAAVSVDGGYTV